MLGNKIVVFLKIQDFFKVAIPFFAKVSIKHLESNLQDIFLNQLIRK